jgi:small subunit ribosomal protein S16
VLLGDILHFFPKKKRPLQKKRTFAPLKTRRLMCKGSGYGFTNVQILTMAVKMRLQRKGRKQRPFYHIVIADARAPRDGRFIEQIGSYNPMTKPATIDIDRDKAFDWLSKGAQPTDTVRAILRFKGVYYKRHLARGVAKGALTTEEADQKYQQWIDEKDAKIAARFAKSAEEKRAFHAAVAGTPPPKQEAPAVVIPAVEVPAAEAEAPAAEAEAPVVEAEAPAVEAEAAEAEAPVVEAEATAPAAEEAPEAEQKEE